MEELYQFITREASRRRVAGAINKVSTFEHLQRGDWGNSTQVWSNWRDIPPDYPDLVAPRYLDQGRAPVGGLPVEEIPVKLKELAKQGIQESSFFFHAWPPRGTMIANCRSLLTPTGEHCISVTRDTNANRNKVEYTGLRAFEAIRLLAGDEGYEYWHWLSRIRELENPTLEFTIHDRPVGPLGLTVVPWDIRNG